jgi:hypothetical protein
MAFLTFGQNGYTYEIGYEGYCGSKQDLDAAAGKTVKIRAGERADILILSTGSVYSRCRGTVSFVPEPGEHYIGKVSGCTISFARALPDGKITYVPTFQVEKERYCLFSK